jgi:hypothetical protein
MASTELKFYKAPKDERGNLMWVPIVIKNKDQLIGFIEGVNMTASVYNIDRESMFYTLSSERFNDITRDGKRLRDMSNSEFVQHAKGVIEEGFDRINAMEAADGGDLDDFCLTIQCSCGNFIGYKDYEKIPKTNTLCDICEKTVIQYTNDEDDCYVYDGVPGRNNEALLQAIESLQIEEEAEGEAVEGDDDEKSESDGW